MGFFDAAVAGAKAAAPRPAPSPFHAVVQAVASGAAQAAHAPSFASAVSQGASQGAAQATQQSAAVNAVRQAAAKQALETNLTQQSRARTTLDNLLSQLFRGDSGLFRLPLDPIGSNSRQSGVERLLQQLVMQQTVRDQFHQNFLQLQQQGLIPHGVKEPPLNFTDTGPSGYRPYTSGGEVFMTPYASQELTTPTAPNHAWAEETLIHELAHTMQSPQTLSSAPLAEGGAQSYSDQATPRVLGPLPISDTAYSGYVRGVRANKGPSWITRGQFK